MNCPKCNNLMDREDGCHIITIKGTIPMGIPYADYYCGNCDNYYQWMYGVKGLRNVTKGEQFLEDWEIGKAWEQYEKDFDIDWQLKG